MATTSRVTDIMLIINILNTHVHVPVGINELHHEINGFCAYAKTKAQISFTVTAKLISAFVFATRIVQFLFFLNPKFQASSLLL